MTLYHKGVAASLAAQGFRVFPLHAAENCDCGRPQGRAPGQCNDKAPRWGGWVFEASCSPAWVERSWHRTDYGVAIATGEDFFVLDLDVKSGANGIEALKALANGRDYETGLKVVSPTGGGQHWYYMTPRNGKRYGSRAGLLATGVDHRCYSGYVVGPGTRTRAGEYRWLSEGSEAPMPSWLDPLVPLLRERTARKVSTEGVDLAGLPLRVLTADLLSSGAHGRFYDPIAKVLAGQSWATKGQRRDVMRDLSVYLQGTFGPLDPGPSSLLFEASCLAVSLEGVESTTDCLWVEEWLADALCVIDWAEKAQKIREAESAQEAIREITAARPKGLAEAKEQARSATSPIAMAMAEKILAYDGRTLDADFITAVAGKKRNLAPTAKALKDGDAWGEEASLTAILTACFKRAAKEKITIDLARSVGFFAPSAQRAGVDEDWIRTKLQAAQSRVKDLEDKGALDSETAISRAFGTDRTEPYTKEEEAALQPLTKRWVVGTSAGYFLRGPYGYLGPFSAELAPARARDVLAPAFSLGVIVAPLNDEGKPKVKTAPELLYEYGTVPDTVTYTLTGGTRLEGESFYYQRCALADLEPRYDPEIARWLDLLGGEAKERLLDWLATCLDLDRPTAALLLQGEGSAGKGMLAVGLSNLFQGVQSPVDFFRAVGPFNDKLARCPVVFADEEIKVPFGYSRSEEFKKIMAETSREVANKNVRGADLLGALRVIVAVNNDAILKFGQELNSKDIETLDRRVVVITVGREPVEYLKSLGGREHTETWTADGLLARHILWLRDTRVIPKERRGSRFLVEGDGTFGRSLEASSLGSSSVLKVLIRCLVQGNEDVIAFRQGALWLQKATLAEKWLQVAGEEKVPENLGDALTLVCEDAPGKNVKVGGKQGKRHRVKEPLLLATAVKAGLEETFLEKMSLLRGRKEDE